MHELSEYEKLREENIKKNEEFLQSLGLSAKHKQRHALKKESDSHSSPSSPTTSKESKAKTKGKKNPRIKKEETNEENELTYTEVRRSKRLLHQTPEEALLTNDNPQPKQIKKQYDNPEYYFHPVDIDEEELISDRNRITAPQVRSYIETNNPEHDELITNEAIVHCVYRMSYMSNAQLVTRLKAISRSAKINSCEKLLVFYYCIKLAGLTQLTKSAEEVLHRLKQL